MAPAAPTAGGAHSLRRYGRRTSNLPIQIRRSFGYSTLLSTLEAAMALRALAREASRPIGGGVASRALCAAAGSSGGGIFGGLVDRVRGAFTSDPAQKAATERIAQARERGASWTQASAEGLRDMRKQKKEEQMNDLYVKLSQQERPYSIDDYRQILEEGVKVESKLTRTQRLGPPHGWQRGAAPTWRGMYDSGSPRPPRRHQRVGPPPPTLLFAGRPPRRDALLFSPPALRVHPLRRPSDARARAPSPQACSTIR